MSINKEKSPAKVFYEVGLDKGAEKKYDEALIAFNKAIDFEPNFGEAYVLRGHAKYMLGNHDDAIQDYRLAEVVYQQNGEPQKAKAAVKHIERHEQMVAIKRRYKMEEPE